MALASLIVAVASAVVAAGALVWTIARDRKQTAALARKSEERKRADLQRRREERIADLIAEAGPRSGSSRGIDHTIRLRNVGRAAARDVHVWLALLLQDDEVSAPASYITRVGSVIRDDGSLECTVTQRQPEDARLEHPSVILASWNDGNGAHRDQEIGRLGVPR